MNTLQQFIAHTKGLEYIIVLIFLALFIVFWKLLNREPPREERAESEASTGLPGEATRGHRKVWKTRVGRLAAVSATLSLAGLFVGLGITRLGTGTTTEVPPVTPVAYRTEVNAGPGEIPNDHESRASCKACHANGVGPAFPASLDHTSFQDNPSFCVRCHECTFVTPKPGATQPMTTTPTTVTTTTPAASEITTQAQTAATTASTSAGGPSGLPADHQGRTACKACHANGMGSAMPKSPDHGAFPDTAAVCMGCHK